MRHISNNDKTTHHHPKSTSSNCVHVVANANKPIDDKFRDFHISIERILWLYCDIVMAVSSIFAWQNAKLMCFSWRLFFSSIRMCSSAMSTWNKSKRSRFVSRLNGLPVIRRIEAFRSDSSMEWETVHIFNQILRHRKYPIKQWKLLDASNWYIPFKSSQIMLTISKLSEVMNFAEFSARWDTCLPHIRINLWNEYTKLIKSTVQELHDIFL